MDNNRLLGQQETREYSQDLGFDAVQPGTDTSF